MAKGFFSRVKKGFKKHFGNPFKRRSKRSKTTRSKSFIKPKGALPSKSKGKMSDHRSRYQRLIAYAKRSKKPGSAGRSRRYAVSKSGRGRSLSIPSRRMQVSRAQKNRYKRHQDRKDTVKSKSRRRRSRRRSRRRRGGRDFSQKFATGFSAVSQPITQLLHSTLTSLPAILNATRQQPAYTAMPPRSTSMTRRRYAYAMPAKRRMPMAYEEDDEEEEVYGTLFGNEVKGEDERELKGKSIYGARQMEVLEPDMEDYGLEEDVEELDYGDDMDYGGDGEEYDDGFLE